MELMETEASLDEARFMKNVLNKPRKAIKLCDIILKRDPLNRDAMLIKAGGLGELFLIDDAVKLIDHIIKTWPDHWEAYYLLALNHLSMQKNEEGFEALEKSLQLNQNFDNIILKAQILYLTGKGDYMPYVEKARKMDKKRAENFMKNHFIYDINTVRPTLSEIFNALCFLLKRKK